MAKIKIIGKNKLNGEVLISGAKNASMPIIIASMLSKHNVTIHNIPFVKDVTTLLSLLGSVGVDICLTGDSVIPKTLILNSSTIENSSLLSDEASKIRTSTLLIGPCLARNGYVKLLKPGGCNIGARKIDLHLSGMQKLGATIVEETEYLELSTNGKRLQGTTIDLPQISVGATENLIMASVLAEGVTTLNNVAIEPEIQELILFLNCLGAKIQIKENRQILIHGVEELSGGEYLIMPDRIEALTYAMMACVTGGEVLLKNISKKHLSGGIDVLEQIGIEFEDVKSEYRFGAVKCKLFDDSIKAISVETGPFPGFATDLQPQLCVLLLMANGVSTIKENIFENRFQHIKYLNDMGADISFEEVNKIKINPIKNFKGAHVCGTDLRACAALVMAGLIANGETVLENADSIDRGYYNFVKNLARFGAKIERIR